MIISKHSLESVKILNIYQDHYDIINYLQVINLKTNDIKS